MRAPTGRINVFTMASHPTFGVEEEFLLADPTTGEPVAVNKAVAAPRRRARRQAPARADQLPDRDHQRGRRAAAANCATAADPAAPDRRRSRRGQRRATARRRAAARRGRTSSPSPTPRATARSPTSSGMVAQRRASADAHVHVAVPSREVAIRVSNRLRPWLPLFLALSANSAVYRNADTGYASWRSIVWARWPSAGPPPHFDSVDEYDADGADAAARPGPCSTTAWSIGTSARRPSSRRSRCVSPTCRRRSPRPCCWPR